ncbi:Response regulator containing a CheY-like receiver domain and an HTH DNA-binding domain [Frankia sp. AgKG'84/4]
MNGAGGVVSENVVTRAAPAGACSGIGGDLVADVPLVAARIPADGNVLTDGRDGVDGGISAGENAPARGGARFAGERLFGRDRERRLVDGLLASVTRRCCALVVRGDPGIGRSAVLRHAERRSTAGVRWLRGVESEAVLPYATLADLVLPLRGHLAGLPDAQRAALEICLALTEGTLAGPYAACAGTLNLLAAAAEEHPLVLLVDDLQWIDEPSRQVLLFVARRLSVERVSMLFAVRSDAAWMCEGSGLPAIELGGLGIDDCAALVAARGINVAPGVAEELAGRVGGNPSALLDAAASLRPAQRAGLASIDELPPPGRRLQRAWSDRLDELPAATRAALVVLAVGAPVPVQTLARALMARPGPPCVDLSDLDAAHDAGLVTTAELGPGAPWFHPALDAEPAPNGGRGLALAHPLLRDVVLRRATPAARLRACQALANACEGDASVWYAAAGSGGPDDQVATALAAVAVRARRRAGYGAAARAWHRAAALTGSREVRVERLLRAAQDAYLAGLTNLATTWADTAASLAADAAARADAELVRARVLTSSGHPTRAHEQLVRAAEALLADDGADARRPAGDLFAEAVLPALMDGRVDLALHTAQRAEDLATAATASCEPPTREVLTRAVHRGRALALAGRAEEARTRLGDVAGQLGAADDVLDQQALVLAGAALLDVEEPRAAVRLLSAAVDAARRDGAPAMLSYGLAVRCELECWRGLWAAAYADGVEALRWAEELGQAPALGFSLGVLARIDAARGDRALCEQRIARLRAETGPYGIGLVDLHADAALGLAAIGHGEYDVAALTLADAWSRMVDRGLGNPNTIPLAADLAEAYIRAAAPDQAVQVVAWLDERARATGLAWPAAVAARCRGLLADGLRAAEAAFAEAERAHDRRSMPFERARTLLCRGEMLRRLRRPAAARRPLREARVVFETLGARPWARRAGAELLAAGDRGVQPAGTGTLVARRARLDQLTPAEVQVARAICDGMNNTEVAAALFISRKTVETHLTRVYRKLAIRSRSELVGVFVASGAGQS